MFLYLIICSLVSPRFLHLSSSWISDGVNLGHQFRLVDSGLEVGVEIFIFYFINLNIVNCSSILLMSISYIHSLLRPHFMRLRLRLGQFEFLIFFFFRRVWISWVCLVTVFFPQFSVFKNNFLFPKEKNLLGNLF